MTANRKIERVLHFNINGLQQRARTGARRAAAFLGMSERFLEGEFPSSLTLGRSIKRQFLPDPLPPEFVPELRANWRDWIVGNALRELDQFLSLFLDDAFDIVQQAKLVSGENPPAHSWRRLDRITNVAEKHRRVLEAAGRFIAPHVDDHDCLATLSQARNCLAHDLGVVTPKRTLDGALTVRWLGFQTILEQGSTSTVLEDVDFPFQVDPEGPQPQILIKVVKVERSFSVGDHINFSPDDLLGICLYYQMIIDRVALAIAEYARDCGVKFPDAPNPDEADKTGS